jgi:hypothetical protein
MDTGDHISTEKVDCITEEQLEVLVAKYTLEYLYRWTNQFDPASLMGIKKLLESSSRPEDILRTLRNAENSLPN